MASYEIQILDRTDFTKQFVVPISFENGLPPLKKPSSVRVQSEVFALTANNTTYAKLGALYGWWDVHPLPPTTPPKWNDPQRYGRISAWGFGRVIESTYDATALPVNSLLFGYLPIGTLPVDMELAPPSPPPPATTNERQEETTEKMQQVMRQLKTVNNISPERAHLMPIYNRYLIHRETDDASSETNPLNLQTDSDFIGWTSVFLPLFLSSWKTNRFVFAWDEQLLMAPSNSVSTWMMSDANVTDAVIISLSGSSKTALPLAWFLRHDRPRQAQPRLVLGVTSKASHAFTDQTGFYDRVLHYDAPATGELAQLSGIDKNTKVVLIDFGGRGSALQHWHDALVPMAKTVLTVQIGVTPKIESPEDLMRKFQYAAGIGAVQVNANDVMVSAIERLGEETYTQESGVAWNRFLENGGVPGMTLEWGHGMEAVQSTWDIICNDQIDSRKGYAIKL